MPWHSGLVGPQYNVAAYLGTPFRVMAGPGTGKTFAIVRRVARLLETGTPPSSILIVSFTRTAARDLVSQLKSLGSPGVAQVVASTLHSLCFSVLTQNAVFQSTNRIPRPLMVFEVDCLVTDLASSFGGKNATNQLLKAFETSWATLQHHQPGWPRDPVQQNFHRELIRWLANHEAMLVGELVTLALDFIRRNPSSPVAPSYAHVLADEYQDLNRADQELVDAFARNGTLTVVGDEDQSIYTTLRHAQPESITRFDQTHPNTHDVPLYESKRCPKLAAHIANSLILRNHPKRPSTIRPAPQSSQGEVYIVQHNSIQEEIANLASFIDWYLGKHSHVKPGETLILSTRRSIGYRMRDELVALGHAAQSFFTEQCLDKLLAREGFCLLTLLVRPDDRPALRAWLGIDNTTARSEAYKRIWNAAQTAGISPRGLLDRIVAGTLQAPPHTSGLLQRYRELQTRIAPLVGLSGTALVDQLWPPHPECADIRGIALSAAASSQIPADLHEQVVGDIIHPELPGDQNDVIRVMSLHKSKGLTAKCVVIMGCVAGALPTLRSGLSTSDRQRAIEEARRLFYVAITRTTQTLVVSSAALSTYSEAKQMGLIFSRYVQGNAVLGASTFVSELGPQAPRPVSGRQWRSSLGF